MPSAPHSLLNSASTATNSDPSAQRLVENPALRSRKLQRAVDDAWRFVPFYREVWRRAGVDPQTLRLPENFHDLPVIGKPDLQQFGIKERIDERYRDGRRLSVESSSGSTGQPFDMYLDAGSQRRRRWRFLRALLASGYRPGRRLMLISSQPKAVIERRPSWLHRIGWDYADVSSSGAALLRAYLASRPHILYGPLSSLLVLGQDLAADDKFTHRPDVVISTAEQVTSLQRQSLLRFFGTDVTDFYGMTELGLVAWRRPADSSYRLEAGGFLFEFLPAEGGAPLERLVVTDLNGGAMPWIRFDTGDLVRRDTCRSGTPVLEFCGRAVDCLLLPGNRKLSPYRLISALEGVPEIERFEVIQREDWSVDVNVWSQLVDVLPLLKQAESSVREVCDGLLRVRAHHRTDPLSASAGKLRPIQSYAQAPR